MSIGHQQDMQEIEDESKGDAQKYGSEQNWTPFGSVTSRGQARC